MTKNKKVIYVRISFRVGKGDWEHNFRKKKVPHADESRTGNNIVFECMELAEGYEWVFGEAELLYWEKSGKDKDRKSYLEMRKGYKRPVLDYEILVMVGNNFSCGLGTEEWKSAVEILTEYMEGFKERNPNLFVYSAVLHQDEETPHLHIDVIPYADGYKRGLTRQFSFSGALEAQRFEKKMYQREYWKDSERKVIEEIMLRHGMRRAPDLGLHRAHLPIEMYKAYVENLDNRIMALPGQIKRQCEMLGKVVVQKEDLDALEQRAMINPLYVETACTLVEELEKAKKECKRYFKYLNAEYVQMQEKQAELDAAMEKTGGLWEENRRQSRQLEVLNQRCRYYESECQQEQERRGVAKQERDASNKVLAEVVTAVSMLIDPYAWGYEIKNLDGHSRQVIQAIVQYGKRVLQESGIEIGTNTGEGVYDVRLPDGVGREMYVMNAKEELER